MKISSKIFGVLGLFVVLGACSKKQEMPKELFFSGRCKVEVKADKGASIYLDGIEVGTGEAAVDMPCGQKQVLVKKSGYKPYYAYHVVDAKRALKISVSLSHLEHGKQDFALSDEIVDQIREGQRIWNPSKGPRPEVKDEGYPAYLGDMNALLASVKGGGAAAAGGDAGIETGTWDKVDDWR